MLGVLALAIPQAPVTVTATECTVADSADGFIETLEESPPMGDPSSVQA